MNIWHIPLELIQEIEEISRFKESIHHLDLGHKGSKEGMARDAILYH